MNNSANMTKNYSAQEFADMTGFAFARYGSEITYLVRPDAHIVGAWNSPDPAIIANAKALALSATQTNGVTAQ